MRCKTQCPPGKFCNPESGRCKKKPSSKPKSSSVGSSRQHAREIENMIAEYPSADRSRKASITRHVKRHTGVHPLEHPAASRLFDSNAHSHHGGVSNAHSQISNMQQKLRVMEAALVKAVSAKNAANSRMSAKQERDDDRAALSSASKLRHASNPDNYVKQIKKSRVPGVKVVAMVFALAVGLYFTGHVNYAQIWPAVVARLPNESPEMLKAASESVKAAIAYAKEHGPGKASAALAYASGRAGNAWRYGAGKAGTAWGYGAAGKNKVMAYVPDIAKDYFRQAALTAALGKVFGRTGARERRNR